jgi:nucleoside-diphosphate-sugar epimerase
MKILITGGNGYVASSLYQALKQNHDITSTNRLTLDLTNRQTVDEFFTAVYFDAVIHCAIQGGSRLKKDDDISAYNNITMFHNLLENKNRYGKLINIGSGAEIYASNTPYGYSKKVINSVIQEIQDFYTLRVFNVFDENEPTTRFIKSSIQKSLKNEFIEIHQNKYMDFFYMKDFIKIVEHYLLNDDLEKEINCVYETKNSLFDVALIIKKLANIQSGILFNESGMAVPYVGNFKNIGLDFVGLEFGIKEVIEKLR